MIYKYILIFSPVIKKYIYKEYSRNTKPLITRFGNPSTGLLSLDILPSCYLPLPSSPFLLSSFCYICKVASTSVCGPCLSTAFPSFPRHGKGLAVVFGPSEVNVCPHSGQGAQDGVVWGASSEEWEGNVYKYYCWWQIDFDSIPISILEEYSNLKVFWCKQIHFLFSADMITLNIIFVNGIFSLQSCKTAGILVYLKKKRHWALNFVCQHILKKTFFFLFSLVMF